MYKNQLQELAQRSCFNLPSYACVREGPDHAPRFKASVNFNGETFESPTFFSTLRQAEHAAAEIALNTLADRGPSKTLAAKVLDETGVYKNLLQETAHRAGLNLPAYTTVRSGPGHVPVFFCTVELARMAFTGEPAKTKKQAQKNAAMTAWFALKQMSQHSSSSHATSSGTQEEQEQVVVARYLASRNPAESSNSSQSTQQKGHHISPASFGIHYQNWASPNLSPAISSHHLWLQEQAAEQQRRLMALTVPTPPVLPPNQVTVPTPPVLPPNQVVPWMHSMLRPTLRPLPPASAMPINSPYYFSNHTVPDPTKTRSMVTIQEIQDEKPEDSSDLSTALPSKGSVNNNNTSEHVSNEKLQHETKQDSLSEVQVKGSPAPRFESSRPPNVRFHPATTSNYRGNVGMALPTASPGVPVGPTPKNFRTPIAPPRMRSGPGSYPVRPRPGRMQAGAVRSPFAAPAVQIRSVVPVCSAAPPRRTPSSTQKGESGDDSRSRNSGDVSVVSSKLGNLEL